jgi:hypothetical protein
MRIIIECILNILGWFKCLVLRLFNKKVSFEYYGKVAIFFLIFIGLLFLLTLYIKGTTKDSVIMLGTVGDFFGGMLNPLFALLGLFALLATIKIQSKELKKASKQLKLSKKEMKRSSKALEEQSLSIKLQNFENTFFNMLDLYNSIVHNIMFEKLSEGQRDIKNIIYNAPINNSQRMYFFGKELFFHNNEYIRKNTVSRDAIKQLSNLVKLYVDNQGHYNKIHNYYEDVFGNYFGFIYQILFFIREAKKYNKVNDPQKYANMFRAQLSKPELTLLSYHCLGTIGKRNFKGLVEEFEFFEHLSLNGLDKKFSVEYEEKVFGKNEDWINIRKEQLQNLTSS